MAKTNAQILALIAACIAQQGNQSGLDGLAEILTELVGRSVPIEVDNIAELTAEQLDALEPGNVVVKKTGNERHAYMVNFKDPVAGKLLLTYADWQNVEGVYYEKGESGWAYVQTDTTHIAS